jgi:23S rRNA (cytosine1962-C5)-methyltransferase
VPQASDTEQTLRSNPLANRLDKNFRRLRRWARRQGLTAFRVYDRDIPEFPFAIDWYDGRAHVVEYRRRSAAAAGAPQQETFSAIEEILGVPRDRIFWKTHLPKVWGREQYPRIAHGSESFVVAEQGLKFWVNLGDYLDTGLFLDHRLTRARIREEARGKRFLNLFSYTGSFTVYAASGGATATTSVDLSNRYLQWSARNLSLNGIDAAKHELVRADAVRWLEQARPERRFELIMVDPPPYSVSAKMRRAFDVQRDHPRLLAASLRLLAPGGILYFSTSFQGFELQQKELIGCTVEEITPGSIPPDFRRRGVHRCWRLSSTAETKIRP